MRIAIAIHGGAAAVRAFNDSAAAQRALTQLGLTRVHGNTWARNENEVEQGDYWSVTEAATTEDPCVCGGSAAHAGKQLKVYEALV